MISITGPYPIEQTTHATFGQTSQQPTKSNESRLINASLDVMNCSKGRLADCTKELASQPSSADLSSHAKMPIQIDSTKIDASPQKFNLWPYIPDDLGVMVFPKADAQLNPMALLTLMNIKGEDNIPPFLTHAAWDDRLWKPYSSASLTRSDTSYAQAFTERWDAMPPEHRTMLGHLWCASSSAAKLLEHHINVQNNFDIVMAAVTHEGGALQYASAALPGERDIVMTAVGQDGLALKYASAALQGERDIVMTAISRCGWALLHASVALKSDRDIVSTAVRRNGLAILFADASLRTDLTLNLIHALV
jgi:hypothetical protein